MLFMFKWLRNKGIGYKIYPENVGSRLVRIMCFLDARCVAGGDSTLGMIEIKINRRREVIGRLQGV